MKDIRFTVGGRDLSKRLVTQNEYGVFYRNENGHYYATTINQFDDARPRGFKRYTGGSHVTSVYADGQKQYPLDFRVGAGKIVKCNEDVKIYNGHKSSGNWCSIQPVKYPQYRFMLVHVYKWQVGRTVKAGDSICEVAPGHLNGNNAVHLHIAGRYKNKSYPMRRFVLNNFTNENMKTYIVQSGDTLKKIAKRFYGDESKYKVIFNTNKPVVYNVNTEKNQDFTNPNVIRVGARLKIPKIKSGDDQIKSLKKQVKGLEKTLKREREEHKKDLKNKENRILDLKGTLSRTLNDLSTAEDKVEEYRRKLNECKKISKGYVDRIQNLIKERSKQDRKIDSLNSKIEELKKDLQRWKNGEYDDLSVAGLLDMLIDVIANLCKKIDFRQTDGGADSSNGEGNN
jgi:LysM repeat protein